MPNQFNTASPHFSGLNW